jgi:hypothetical protein
MSNSTTEHDGIRRPDLPRHVNDDSSFRVIPITQSGTNGPPMGENYLPDTQFSFYGLPDWDWAALAPSDNQQFTGSC